MYHEKSEEDWIRALDDVSLTFNLNVQTTEEGCRMFFSDFDVNRGFCLPEFDYDLDVFHGLEVDEFDTIRNVFTDSVCVEAYHATSRRHVARYLEKSLKKYNVVSLLFLTCIILCFVFPHFNRCLTFFYSHLLTI